MNRLRMISLVPAFTLLSAVAPANGKKTVPVVLSLLAVLLSGLSSMGAGARALASRRIAKEESICGADG